jgi:hypothetical protein
MNVFNQLTSNLFKIGETLKTLPDKEAVIVPSARTNKFFNEVVNPRLEGEIQGFRAMFKREVEATKLNFTDDYEVRKSIIEATQKVAPNVLSTLLETSLSMKDFDQTETKNKVLEMELIISNLQSEIKQLRATQQDESIQPVFDTSSIEAMVREQVEQARAGFQDEIQRQVNLILASDEFQTGGITQPEFLGNNYNFEARKEARKQKVQFIKKSQAENKQEQKHEAFLDHLKQLARIGDTTFSTTDIQHKTGISLLGMAEKLNELENLGIIYRVEGKKKTYALS